MMTRIHAGAGAVALGMISVFWLSTVSVELMGDAARIAQVKQMILWGFLVLVPAMALVGGTGFRLGQKLRGPVVEKKRRRMPFIAANGLLILVPSAFFLAAKAQAGAFDTVFYVVQALEFVAGAVNIALLGANMRDGLRLAARRRNL
ncbi:hypothetical protein [Shimia sp. FJ5]|uniref:hypothetical protein n=1 Tax=Shimia sp. FJ5 TaxID=3079054 RepID=UPI00261CB6A6|nr:hypothetical protein [Shimia sp. FJ5]MDV4145330.1 hypothetical protein [Shimia sp. FJ5]